MIITDVIIPTYKPGKELFTLLDRLKEQTVSINHVLLINTEEKYFEDLLYGNAFSEKYANWVSVYHVSQREFDHGGTRRLAVSRLKAPVFVLMTQDAMPADPHMLENLLRPLEQEDVAVSYARQLPREDCRMVEKYTRSFNYPEKSRIKTATDLNELGIKTYFCSNVCAAYKRSVYEELGGFVKHTIFNEDMIFAAGAIKHGYAIAYAADAKVIHSHNYTNGQQFHRNFDLGVSQAEHPEVFANVPSEKEGQKMVSKTVDHLWKEKQGYRIPGFILQCFCKYAGYLLGKHYRHLPRWMIRKCTSNQSYWQAM